MLKKYDVIIVGAGPAGCAAAKTIAEKGHNVLIIDRQTFPRDKVCGDGLTPGATKLLQQLDAFSFLNSEDVYPIQAIRFVTPKLQSLDVPFKSKHEDAGFLIIKRQKLDHALLQSAQKSDADFLLAEATGLLFNEQQVCGVKVKLNGQKRELKARLVIGADGASSVVARSLKAAKIPDKHRFLAIRGYVKGFKTTDHLVEFIWTADLKPGYFWIFPTGNNKANIGLGLPADLYKKNKIDLKQHFYQLLEQSFFKERVLPEMEIDQLRAWPIPLAGLFKTQRVFDGAMLIGDAGYWVDPLSGEGIHNTLKTGIISAEVALKALQANQFSADFLQKYEQRAWQQLGPTIKRSLAFVQGMRYLPWLLELYFFFARHSQSVFQRFFSNLSHDFEFDFNRQ